MNQIHCLELDFGLHEATFMPLWWKLREHVKFIQIHCHSSKNGYLTLTDGLFSGLILVLYQKPSSEKGVLGPCHTQSQICLLIKVRRRLDSLCCSYSKKALSHFPIHNFVSELGLMVVFSILLQPLLMHCWVQFTMKLCMLDTYSFSFCWINAQFTK